MASGPTRNLGGVIIAVAGAYDLVATLINAIARSIPGFPTNLFGTIFVLMLAGVILVPLAVLVGFVPLAFGRRGVSSIAGVDARSKLWVFSAGLVGCLAPLLIIALFLSELGESDKAISGTTSATIVVAVFALLVALVAAITIARARVASGFARWSLFLTIALVAVAIVLEYTESAGNYSAVPLAVGLLVLGLSYWRVGVPDAASVPGPSNEMAKSLAE